MKSIKNILLGVSVIFAVQTAVGQCTVVAPVPNDACYQQVIATDSWCCNNSWDAICQGEYDDCMSTGGCPVVAPVPNDACYQQVIAADSWCCNNSWDATCQSEYDNCMGGGGSDPCSNITPLIGCGTSTGAGMSGTGTWDIGACGWSTPGAELIYSFTATSSGIHNITVSSITGGFVDFMWIDASLGCSPTAGWNCVGSIFSTGSYGSMNWTAGNTYYILLDPEGTGAYNVTFNVDCPNPGGPVTASDCVDAIPVCTNLAFQVDPSGYGLVNELCTYCIANPGTNPASSNSGCLLSGELNSTWFTVNVAAGGTLEFSFGSPGGGNCYDWIMWAYDPSTCTNILGNSQAPVTCDWNVPCDSYTGMASTVPAGGFAGNFQPTMNVNTGDQFLICFSNYSSALTTVPLNFFGTADISCTLLPVEISSFFGEDHGGYVELIWTTASEINSAYFDVEKSTNGVDFIKLQSVDASGTNLNGETYRAYDYNPGEDITYYRIKYVDYDQKYKYSDVIAVTRELIEHFSIITSYPNPAQDVFTIQMVSPEQGEVKTEIIDLSGKTVYSASASLNKGMQFLDLPVSSLSTGTYLVQVNNSVNGLSEVIRLVVE